MKWSLLAVALTAGFISLSPVAWVQPTEKARRIGVLQTSSLANPGIKQNWEGLVDGLREHGWEEGRNMVLEGRFRDPTQCASLS
jgi:hypothetical protein